MNTCTKCGAANTPEAFSCGNCGAPLRGHALNHGGEVNTQAMGRLAPVGAGKQEESSIDMSVIGAKIIQVVVILAIALAAAWFFLVRSSPEMVANQFVQAASRKDTQAMMNCFSAGTRELFGDDQLQMIGGMISAGAAGKEIEVTVDNLQVTGNTAKGNITAKAKDEKNSGSNSSPMWFSKDPGLLGKWKLDFRSMIVNQLKQAAGNPALASMARAQLQKQMGNDPKRAAAWEAVFKEAGI